MLLLLLMMMTMNKKEQYQQLFTENQFSAHSHVFIESVSIADTRQRRTRSCSND
jgi:hypothetical protein